MSKILKGIVKFSIAAAAVGGVCYAFKDKIKESDVYKEHNVDDKINKVKTTIKDKLPKTFDNEKDYVDEGDLFLDDLDLDSENLDSEDIERDYVSLNTDSKSEAVEDSEEVNNEPEAVPEAN